MKYLKLTFIFSLIFFVAICFIACEKDSNTTELFWHSTKCKDPWHQESIAAESQAYVANMRTYLTAKEIVFESDNIRIIAGTADDSNCVTCSCKLTQRLAVIFNNEYVAEAKVIGFTEN